MVPLSMSGDDAFTLLVGTSKCAVYVVSYTAAAGLGAELLQTCHFARVNDAAFPAGFSEVFATCAGEEVRGARAHARARPFCADTHVRAHI